MEGITYIWCSWPEFPGTKLSQAFERFVSVSRPWVRSLRDGGSAELPKARLGDKHKWLPGHCIRTPAPSALFLSLCQTPRGFCLCNLLPGQGDRFSHGLRKKRRSWRPLVLTPSLCWCWLTQCGPEHDRCAVIPILLIGSLPILLSYQYLLLFGYACVVRSLKLQ